MSNDCIFCKIVAGEIPSERVYEDDLVLAFRDISPAAPTHVLLIPKEHVPTADDLTEAHADVLTALTRAAQTVARQEGIEGAYRLVVNCGKAAGQAVFHLHVHLIGGRGLTWPPG